MRDRENGGRRRIRADPHAVMLRRVIAVTGGTGMGGHIHIAHIHSRHVRHVVRGNWACGIRRHCCVAAAQNQPAWAGHESDRYQGTTKEAG